MTEVKPKRLATWKILGILAAVAAALLLIAVLKGRAMTEVRWELFRREMTQLAEAERARDFSRPPLRGSAEPGNAWDDYTVAIAATRKLQNRNKLGDLVQRTPQADPVWGATVLEQGDAVLTPLRRGALRWTSSRSYDWEQGISMTPPDIAEWQNVAQLAILKGRALLEAGRPREAVGVLLDAAQFSRDVADDGPLVAEMIGVAMMFPVLEGIRELAASEKADADSLADLDRGLAMLEANFPKHAGCLRRELLAVGMTFAHEEPDTAIAEFPVRLLTLNAFKRRRETLEESAEACDRPWAEAIETSQRIDADFRKSWNPITRMMALGQLSTERVMRERLAQVRLLRIATRYRRTGERLDLADPFGTTLKSAASAGGLKLWSVGADGIDGGGSGEWQPGKGADIVLEARR